MPLTKQTPTDYLIYGATIFISLAIIIAFMLYDRRRMRSIIDKQGAELKQQTEKIKEQADLIRYYHTALTTTEAMVRMLIKRIKP